MRKHLMAARSWTMAEGLAVEHPAGTRGRAVARLVGKPRLVRATRRGAGPFG